MTLVRNMTSSATNHWVLSWAYLLGMFRTSNYLAAGLVGLRGYLVLYLDVLKACIVRSLVNRFQKVTSDRLSMEIDCAWRWLLYIGAATISNLVKHRQIRLLVLGTRSRLTSASKLLLRNSSRQRSDFFFRRRLGHSRVLAGELCIVLKHACHFLLSHVLSASDRSGRTTRVLQSALLRCLYNWLLEILLAAGLFRRGVYAIFQADLLSFLPSMNHLRAWWVAFGLLMHWSS